MLSPMRSSGFRHIRRSAHRDPADLPTRHFRVQGFPYKIAYRLREHNIHVVALAHTSRRPGYWMDRR